MPLTSKRNRSQPRSQFRSNEIYDDSDVYYPIDSSNGFEYSPRMTQNGNKRSGLSTKQMNSNGRT